MALLGALLALSAPGFGCWILAWLALIPALLWVNRQQSWRQVFGGGFWLGAVFQGLYCIWFFDLHPLTWLGFTEWGSRLTTLAGWLLITTEGGMLTGLILTAYLRVRHPVCRCILFPLLWVGGFWLLQATPMALPWALLEYTQVDLPVMREVAGWIGTSGLVILLTLHAALWVELWSGGRYRKAIVGPLLLPGLIWLAGLVFDERDEKPFPLPVSAIQANLPIELIRSARMTETVAESAYLDPVKEANLPVGTLVVYPEEGVVPDVVYQSRPFENSMMLKLWQLATLKRLYVLVGVTCRDEWGHLYNGMALLSPESKVVQFYHKRKLVPFGEFTPYGLGDFVEELLGHWRVAYSAPFSGGHGAPLLKINNIPAGVLICFELIDASPVSGGFAGEYRRKGAEILLNASNLGWFHQNPFMEAQFLAIARMRAAENRLPMVVSSNTGISALIASNGTVLARTQPFSKQASGTQIIFHP